MKHRHLVPALALALALVAAPAAVAADAPALAQPAADAPTLAVGNDAPALAAAPDAPTLAAPALFAPSMLELAEKKGPATEGSCSASVTCPGSQQHGIPPYTLSCEGNYSCFTHGPQGPVECDGQATCCFPNGPC